MVRKISRERKDVASTKYCETCENIFVLKCIFKRKKLIVSFLISVVMWNGIAMVGGVTSYIAYLFIQLSKHKSMKLWDTSFTSHINWIKHQLHH